MAQPTLTVQIQQLESAVASNCSTGNKRSRRADPGGAATCWSRSSAFSVTSRQSRPYRGTARTSPRSRAVAAVPSVAAGLLPRAITANCRSPTRGLRCGCFAGSRNRCRHGQSGRRFWNQQQMHADRELASDVLMMAGYAPSWRPLTRWQKRSMSLQDRAKHRHLMVKDRAAVKSSIWPRSRRSREHVATKRSMGHRSPAWRLRACGVGNCPSRWSLRQAACIRSTFGAGRSRGGSASHASRRSLSRRRNA